MISLILLIFCSCVTRNWERAKTENNVQAYENFLAKYVNVKHESMADCKIYAQEALSVEILRTGNLYYKGSPEITYINEEAKNQLIKIE